MSCFFCARNDHVTLNCYVYDTDEARRQIVRRKKCCQNCLTGYDIARFWCDKCVTLQKCYFCFLPTHLTVYCPDRFTVASLFPPKIDQNLLSRFLKTLTLEEKYFMAFSFSSIFALVTLKPLKITWKKQIKFSNLEIFDHSDLVITETLRYNFINGELKAAGNSIKLPVFRVICLELNKAVLSANELLQLLSSKTVWLICCSMQIIPEKVNPQQKLTFREILKKAPNLEEINLLQANIEIVNSWPYDLLQLNHGAKLMLGLSIDDVNFNVGRLATLMRCKPVKLHLDITLTDDNPQNGYFDTFKNEFEILFMPVECEKPGSLCITYDNKPSRVLSRTKEYYMLKKQEMLE